VNTIKMTETKNLGVEQKRERMSRPARVGGQGQRRGPSCKLIVKAIKHCERVDALMDAILRIVTRVKRANCMILGWEHKSE
jgi:hypothetical protein